MQAAKVASCEPRKVADRMTAVRAMSTSPRPRDDRQVTGARRLASRSPAIRGIAVGLGFAVMALVVTLSTSVVWDDPSILFRYAVNLAEGHGWTFNPGQVTDNAVTSPMSVLVLAAMVRVGISLGLKSDVDTVQAAGAIVFSVATWTASFFTYLTFRRSDREVAGFVAGVFVATSPLLVGVRGMESAGYLAFVAIALWAMLGRQQVVLGLALGFCVLTRPDSIVFAGMLLAWMAWRERRLPYLAGALAAGVLAIWLGVSQLLTGSLVPSTLAAKQAQAQSGLWPTDFDALTHFLSSTSSPVWSYLVLPLVLVGAWFAVRQKVLVLAPLASAAVALAVIYGLLQVAAYPWHMVLQYYLGLLLAGLAVDAFLLPGRAGQRSALINGLVIGYCVALVAVGFSQLPPMSPDRRDVPLVAAWLDEHTPPDATVAAMEVGRLGLLSNRRMVDYLGLLDSHANDHVRRGDWTWWPGAYQPDYWVGYRTLKWDPASKVSTMPGFDAAFKEVYETEYLVIYQRQEIIPADPAVGTGS